MHTKLSRLPKISNKQVGLLGAFVALSLTACGGPAFNPSIGTIRLLEGETVSITGVMSARAVSIYAPRVDAEPGNYTAQFFVDGNLHEGNRSYTQVTPGPLLAYFYQEWPCRTLPQGRPFEVRTLIYNEAGTLLHDLSGNVLLTCTR